MITIKQSKPIKRHLSAHKKDFGTVPVDNFANNAAVICRKLYALTLAKKLNSNINLARNLTN